jgi:hypothetical protein
MKPFNSLEKSSLLILVLAACLTTLRDLPF